MTPCLNIRVWNTVIGACVGVMEGVVVRVGVALGLGETVQVGDEVLVGVTVLVAVSVGAFVHVALGLGGNPKLHPVRKQATITSQLITFRWVLICNGVQRRNVKKGIVVADFSF